MIGKHGLRIVGRVLLAGVIMVELCGCGNGVREHREEAERLLREKYREEFTVTLYQGMAPGGAWYSAQAYAKDEPDILFSVTVDRNGQMTDTFVQHRVAEKLSDRVGKCMKDLDGSYYICAAATVQNTVSDYADISVEQFQKDNPGNEFVVFYFWDYEKYGAEKIYDLLENAAKEIPELTGYLIAIPVEQERLSDIQNFAESNDVMVSKYGQWDREVDVRIECGRLGIKKEDFVRKAGGLL